MSRFGYSLDYVQSFAKTGLWDKPLRDICRKTDDLVVKDFMHSPQQGEYIREDAGLDEAIHQMLLGRHNSLLVTRGEDIVGILRLDRCVCLCLQQYQGLQEIKGERRIRMVALVKMRLMLVDDEKRF